MNNLVRLGEILEVQNGFAFASENFVDNDEGFPLIRIRDLGAKETKVGYKGNFRNEFVVDTGDLLIGMDGDFECHRWNGPKALLNQRVCRLRNFSKSLNREYLFYWIDRSLKDVHDKTSFVTVKHISSKQILNLQIPLPPLDEQRRIVGVLDRAAEIRRRADAARAKARAIIPALFLETFGDPATNPKGWPETQLSEVLSTTLSYGSMTSPRSSDDEWLDIRVANIKGNQIDHSDRKYVTLATSLVAKHSLADGDIVLARAIGSESHLGKCAVVFPGKARWAYDSHIMRIRVDQRRTSPVWLHALMNTEGGKARLLRQRRASAIQHNINTKEVAIFKFPLPPLPLQTAFAERAERLESLARHLDAAAAKAQAMAAGLSAEVFGS